MLIIRRHQCTYCGGDVESTFSTTGILAACFLFPIGNHLVVDLAGIKNIFWATITTDGRNLIYQTLILLLRALPITYFGNFPLTQGNCFWGILFHFKQTRSCAALRAADLDWIVELGYSWGGCILGCSQRLALCLRTQLGLARGNNWPWGRNKQKRH